MQIVTAAETTTVRFHFDGGYEDVFVTLGNTINLSDIPTPKTRYGMLGIPGEVFKGWYKEIFPLMHYINNPNRAVAFDFNQEITIAMLDSDKIFHLYASWLQFGDINGDGIIDMADTLLLSRFILNEITINEIIAETSDINGDGTINIRDYILLRSFILWNPVILGTPYQL